MSEVVGAGEGVFLSVLSQVAILKKMGLVSRTKKGYCWNNLRKDNLLYLVFIFVQLKNLSLIIGGSILLSFTRLLLFVGLVSWLVFGCCCCCFFNSFADTSFRFKGKGIDQEMKGGEEGVAWE